jgi:hypothetical protein
MSDFKRKAIQDAVDSMSTSKEDLLVLKGFNLEDIDGTHVDLSAVLKNKVGHFMAFVESDREFASFEEFVALEPFAVEQFRRIIILENNIYSSFFPLGVSLPEAIVASLAIHFDKDSDDSETEIGDLSKYLEVVSNLTRVNGMVHVVYPEPNSTMSIRRVPVWQGAHLQIQERPLPESGPVNVIYTELDYIGLLTQILENPNEGASDFSVGYPHMLWSGRCRS